MIETRPKKTHERALLIGLEKQGVSKWDLQDSLEELAELANSAGAEVVDTVTQKLQKPRAQSRRPIADRAGTIAILAAAINADVGPSLATNWRHRHARSG